jgi:hypothetical protein
VLRIFAIVGKPRSNGLSADPDLPFETQASNCWILKVMINVFLPATAFGLILAVNSTLYFRCIYQEHCSSMDFAIVGKLKNDLLPGG